MYKLHRIKYYASFSRKLLKVEVNFSKNLLKAYRNKQLCCSVFQKGAGNTISILLQEMIHDALQT